LFAFFGTAAVAGGLPAIQNRARRVHVQFWNGGSRLLRSFEPQGCADHQMKRTGNPAIKMEMSEMQTDWVSLLISWLAFLILIGVWFWFSWSMGMRARGASGATMIKLYEQQVAETRRTNASLERTALALEKRQQQEPSAQRETTASRSAP
jgi:ATP-dependent Zn protease